MENFFYITSALPDEKGGIYLCKFGTGNAPEIIDFTTFPGAGYLAFAPGKKMLLATGIADENSNCAAAFAVAPDGKLEMTGYAPTCGKASCHVTVTCDEKFVYTANYLTGGLSEFSFGDHGELTLTQLVSHEGVGVHPVRQTSPHIHFSSLTPDEKYIVAIDLGLDSITSYPYSSERGIDPERAITNIITPAGSGPRHLVFASDGKTAFLVNELGNTAMVLDYADGVFAIRQTLPTLPVPQDCMVSKAGAIRLSADGKTLVISNRGVDTLKFFSVGEDMKLTGGQFTYCGGISPRDVNFLAGDKIFASCNEFSEKVTFFDVTPDGVVPNGYELKIPRALFIGESGF